MIIFKNNKGYQTLSSCTDKNILTLIQIQNLQEATQTKKEVENAPKRLIEIPELEETQELTQEKQMLESQLQQAQGKILTEAEKEALLVEIAELDELVYVVDDNSELARKVMEAAPYFDFVLDDTGELVDIIPLPKPTPAPQPPTDQERIDAIELAVLELMM